MRRSSYFVLVFALLIAVGWGTYSALTPPAGAQEPEIPSPVATPTPPPDPVGAPRKEQLPAQAADIATDADGALSIPDRGDGCSYPEVARGQAQLDLSGSGIRQATDVIVLQAPGCDVFYWFIPDTGELRALIASEAP